MNLARDFQPQLEAIPLGMAVFDQEGVECFATDLFRSLFQPHDGAACRYDEYLTWLMRGTMKDEFRASLHEAQLPLEGYVTAVDGRTLHVRHDSLLQGSPGVVCLLEDISERLDDVRISHIVRGLLDNTIDSIGMADSEHRAFFTNRRMADTLGVSSADVQGKRITIEDVQPCGIGPYPVSEALKIARTNGSVSVEARVTNLQTREERLVSQVITAHTDPVEDRPIYSAVMRDMSELYHYRNELEETNRQLEMMLGKSESELQKRTREVEYSRQLWRSIVDHQLNLVVIATGAGEVLFANRLKEGVGGQTLCGKQLSDLVEPAYQDEFKKRFAGLLESENEIITMEAAFALNDKIRFTGLASLNSFVRNDGERVVTMLVADITESLRDRERLMESQKFAATGRMAARLAHEINNPLAGIKSALSIIRSDLGADLPSAHYLDLSMNELDRVSLIIKQLYGLYCPHQELPRELDLYRVVNDCILLLDARFCAKGVKVHMAGEKTCSVVGADNSLRQVLFNVLGNALEACDPGGEISIRILPRGGYLALAVRDSGCGLCNIDEESVYEPFFSTKKSHDGAGLGLGMAVSRGLIRSMGGDIRIRDRRVGRGALCVLFLPRAAPDWSI